MVVLCVLFATPANDSFAADKNLIDVEIQPAIGQPHGRDEGKGLGSHVPKAPAPLPEPEPFVPPLLAPPDPEAVPTTTDPEEPLPDAAAAESVDAGDAGVLEAASSSGDEADLTTPPGSENVPPAFGSPDGVDGGQGTGPRKISAQYLGILTSWARARILPRGHGLGPPPGGTRPCARVRIQIAPSLQVTGASLGSSGHAEFDQKVQGDLGNVTGASVPPDPEGGPPPPSLTVNVCWD
jgi:hypothetical protein